MTTPTPYREHRKTVGAITLALGLLAALGFLLWARQHDDAGRALAIFRGDGELWAAKEAGRQLLGYLAAGLGLVVAIVGLVVILTTPKAVEA